MWRETARPVRQKHPRLGADGLRTAVLRELIARQVFDLIEESGRRLKNRGIGNVAEVRACPEPLIGFGAELIALKGELERFLREKVYRHHRVMRMAEKGKRFLCRLFEEMVAKPELLPERHLRRWSGAPDRLRRTPNPADVSGETSLQRVVADYLAGMTDRFAGEEYARLFHPERES